MNINLMQFQLKAIKELLESMEGSGRKKWPCTAWRFFKMCAQRTPYLNS